MNLGVSFDRSVGIPRTTSLRCHADLAIRIHAGVYALDDLVTLARCRTEAFLIKDCDRSTALFNQRTFLQNAGCDADAGPSRPQHVRQKFLREAEFIRPCAVTRHQQVADDARLH